MEKDPTEGYQTRIMYVLKENGVIVSERIIAMNSSAPKLKGLVKLDVSVGIINNAAMVKRIISYDETEKRDKAGQSGVYKITCGQCDSVYIRETGRKYCTRMKEHAKSKTKRDKKSLFGKHCNVDGHSSKVAKQKFVAFHTETSTRRRKLRK